jgi:hypothetical protein
MNEEISVKVKQISKFHKDYEENFLKDRIKNKKLYLSSPKDALFFIFSYSFYQGRIDELSRQFEERARNTVNLFLENNDILSISAPRITDKDVLKNRYKSLYNKLEENGVNKEGDRLMVLSLINFIQSNNQKNIVKFIIKKIESNAISEAYKKLDEIYSIGPKVASFILRDIVYIYELEKNLNKNDYYFLQPIDTWVHKVSRVIGLINKDKFYKDESKDITNRCFEFGVNPIHYNQGAWYIGTHSLEILLRNIKLLE